MAEDKWPWKGGLVSMKIKNTIINIIIGGLCFVFVILSFITFAEAMDYHRDYHPGEDSFLYAIEDGDYSRLVEMMYRNEVAGVETSEIYEECYAVARYYEAATYYKAYKNAGDMTRAQEKKQIMEGQISRMGELSGCAEDIDKMLKLE